MLKRILIWVARAVAVFAIFAGIGTILDNPKNNLTTGISLIAVGIVVIIVSIKIKDYISRKEYKRKQKPNICTNCGGSLKGAQYRYNWTTYDGDIVFESDMTIIAICPKCGLEKKFSFKCPPPSYFELKKPNFDEKAYAQRKIRERVDELFED